MNVAGVSPHIVDCIAEARAPSEQELRAVADRIRSELTGCEDDQTALSEVCAAAQLMAYRVAHAAMMGCA
jgi:hypothetical protein